MAIALVPEVAGSIPQFCWVLTILHGAVDARAALVTGTRAGNLHAALWTHASNRDAR